MAEAKQMQTYSPHQEINENERVLRGLIELRPKELVLFPDTASVYDELHAGGYLRQKDSFYKWVLGLLRPKAGQTMLDVSCGQGTLVHWARLSGLRAVGFDLSSSALRLAARQTHLEGFALADAERMPLPDDRFDYVTNIGSLEHYTRPHWAVREMARVLRADGLALVLLPNSFGLLGNVLHVLRKGDVFDDGQPVQRYGTFAQWRRLLDLNGLRVVRTFKFERACPRTWQDAAWYAFRPHKLGRMLLALFIPRNLSSFLVFLCQKASS